MRPLSCAWLRGIQERLRWGLGQKEKGSKSKVDRIIVECLLRIKERCDHNALRIVDWPLQAFANLRFRQHSHFRASQVAERPQGPLLSSPPPFGSRKPVFLLN